LSYFYFDETIRERGEFIIGALVVSEHDLSPIVSDEWKRLGLNPELAEYKSSDPKKNCNLGVAQRHVMAELLYSSKLALTIAPMLDRRKLGQYCTDLLFQIADKDFIQNGDHFLYLDENIALGNGDRERLRQLNIIPFPNSNSKKVGGIQVADHAAHALGGMHLEEMGIINKKVRAGENSGYHPDELLELGFELWASLRYAMIGRNEHIEGLSPHPDDPANPYFRIDGVGLHIASTCSEMLSQQARSRFGVNYLGCIH
jgi:hypothetical protein